MAKIMIAQLQITPDGQNKAKVSVISRIRFTALEMSLMQNQGLKFRLDCQIFGQDNIFEGPPDDFLFVMGPSKIFPDATPTVDESHTFSVTVPKALLDEDAGTDEIYARVSLRNLFTTVTVNKKSNVVVQAF